MSLFDKIFNKKSKSEELRNYIQGISVNNSVPVYLDILNNDDSKIRVVSNMDPSKKIDSKHWDALPPEAQSALRDQGFYSSSPKIPI